MVNYRRVVCEVALLGALVALAAAAPTPDCGHSIHYDQRQNGTENYRLNIDGVVVAVAPAETLLSAMGDMDDLMELLSFGDLDSPSSSSSIDGLVPISFGGDKPVVKPQEKPEKPTEDKPSEEKPAEPEEVKPDAPAKPVEKPLSDVSLDDVKTRHSDAPPKKQEKAQRLKNRLASFLLPLLRKTRHH